MSLQARHRGAQRTDAHGAASTTTAAAASEASHEQMVQMLGPLNDAQRMRLELIIRASASAETALPHAVAVLVGDDRVKIDAIVAAISSNDALREQWQRAWTRLRRA